MEKEKIDIRKFLADLDSKSEMSKTDYTASEIWVKTFQLHMPYFEAISEGISNLDSFDYSQTYSLLSFIKELNYQYDIGFQKKLVKFIETCVETEENWKKRLIIINFILSDSKKHLKWDYIKTSSPILSKKIPIRMLELKFMYKQDEALEDVSSMFRSFVDKKSEESVVDDFCMIVGKVSDVMDKSNLDRFISIWISLLKSQELKERLKRVYDKAYETQWPFD
ncbi:MAG: hypothetical protein NTW62_02730 [Candidatus Nomurabacteria bacterium]|nr:hypothetical protein [Candidatus Nomurabacteria bacterium]